MTKRRTASKALCSVICWDTDFGPITGHWVGDELMELRFGPEPVTVSKPSPVQSAVGRELREYFGGKRTKFSCVSLPSGTEFQRQVWKALLKIPFGQTRTYAQIANQIGRPKAQRAVGNAVGSNPFPVLIPCHRVVRSDGELGGFSAGPRIKPRLLRLEGVTGIG